MYTARPFLRLLQLINKVSMILAFVICATKYIQQNTSKIRCYHSLQPHPESGGKKFDSDKSIPDGGGLLAPNRVGIFYLGGAQIFGWGIRFFLYKNVFFQQQIPFEVFQFSIFSSFPIISTYFSIFIHSLIIVPKKRQEIWPHNIFRIGDRF